MKKPLRPRPLLAGLLLLSLRFGLSPPTAAQTLSQGLLARFPFDNSLTDASGNMGSGTATNAAFGPDARNLPDAALRLAGTGEVAIEPAGLLDFGTTGSFTFSVSFRTLSSGTQAFFSNKGVSSATASATLAQGWSLGFDNSLVGRLYLDLVRDNFYNGTLALATQASFNDGRWHTAAVVVDRTSRQIRLFVDGTAQPLLFVTSNDYYGAVAGSTFTLASAYGPIVNLNPGYSQSQANTTRINNRFGLGYNGSLDEARFYNRALTAAEVQALSALVLAARTKARAADDLVQVYPNPAPGGQISVRLAPALQGASLAVYSALGRRMPVGLSSVPAGSVPQSLRLTGLPAGWYVLVITGKQTLSQRFQIE